MCNSSPTRLFEGEDDVEEDYNEEEDDDDTG
jgi:hypothetical protein